MGCDRAEVLTVLERVVCFVNRAQALERVCGAKGPVYGSDCPLVAALSDV